MSAKTTIELPEDLLLRAKKRALEEGKSFKTFYTEALKEKLNTAVVVKESTKPWMGGFGELADLKGENQRILDVIESEFEVLDEEA